MHPWTVQHMAEERSQEQTRAAIRARMAHEARSVGGGSPRVSRRATRVLGELLIRTGWRLAGPEAPANGIRPRLTLRAHGASIIDPC